MKIMEKLKLELEEKLRTVEGAIELASMENKGVERLQKEREAIAGKLIDMAKISVRYMNLLLAKCLREPYSVAGSMYNGNYLIAKGWIVVVNDRAEVTEKGELVILIHKRIEKATDRDELKSCMELYFSYVMNFGVDRDLSLLKLWVWKSQELNLKAGHYV